MQELSKGTREITTLFDQLVGPWNATTMMTELTAEIGTLADSVMITEGHRKPRPGEVIDLEDDITDVLFLLIRLADYYHINLDIAYHRMLNRTQQKLKQLIEHT